jgi:CheY-like chemotaxis protein
MEIEILLFEMSTDNMKNLKFFVVDDDSFSRMLYNQQLVNLGYKNSVLMDNGFDCISKLDLAPDIILLDYDMKPMNGLDVLRHVKAVNPNINILFISGNKEKEVITEAFKHGAFDYVFKGDHDLEMIRHAVNKIVSLKSETDANNYEMAVA